MDQGWGSVWVKMVSVWVTAGLHAWTLVAPAVFPDRDFTDDDELYRRGETSRRRRETRGDVVTTPLVVTTPP